MCTINVSSGATESPHPPHRPAGDRDSQGQGRMPRPSPDTQPTAAASLWEPRHPQQELLRPHQHTKRLGQAPQPQAGTAPSPRVAERSAGGLPARARG